MDAMTTINQDEIVRAIFRKGIFLFNHIIKYEEVKEIFNDW
jgi:hypothetical protein